MKEEGKVVKLRRKQRDNKVFGNTHTHTHTYTHTHTLNVGGTNNTYTLNTHIYQGVTVTQLSTNKLIDQILNNALTKLGIGKALSTHTHVDTNSDKSWVWDKKELSITAELASTTTQGLG